MKKLVLALSCAALAAVAFAQSDPNAQPGQSGSNSMQSGSNSMQSGSNSMQSGSNSMQSGSNSMQMHVMARPSDMNWGPAPNALPPGAKLAVLSGDPNGNGEYTVRVQMPAGYLVRPHFHPTDENLTLISGSFSVGMGDKVDKSTGRALEQGGFANMPAQMHHYAWSDNGAILQIHGMGPFAITYINPSDDPRQAASEGRSR
jgi:hypothetical protein